MRTKWHGLSAGLLILLLVVSQRVMGAETCATLAGISPPIAGSTGTLVLPNLALKTFQWSSSDPIFGVFDSGVVTATRWTVPGTNPIRVVFVGTSGGVTISADVLLAPYNRAVVDLTGATKRIRYLVNLASPQIQVTNVVFDHKGGNTNDTDGLNIRKNVDDDLEHIGNGVGKGEWIKGSRNEPALYVAKKNVTVKARFTANAAITKADISATAKAGLLPNAKSVTVNFAGGVSNPEFIELSLDRATDDQINKVDETWQWNLANVNGCGGDASKFDESGPHKVYTVLEIPKTPWYDTAAQHPWVSALDFVIDTIGAKGKKTVPDATSKIATFLHSSYGLKYDTVSGAPKYVSASAVSAPKYDLTAFQTKANKEIVNCYDLAASVAALSNLIGGASEYHFMGPFGYINQTALVGHGPSNNPFFDSPTVSHVKVVDEDACRGDPDPNNRSAFGNHAFVELSAKVYDANVEPHLGTESRDDYIKNSIDVKDRAGRTCNKDAAGNAGNVRATATITLK